MRPSPRLALAATLLVVATLAWGPSPTGADGVRFREAASELGLGDYRRTPSLRNAQYSLFLGESAEAASPFCKDLVNGLLEEAGVLPPGGDAFTSPFPMPTLACVPQKSRGAPGVCIFDHDGDGDQDLYVPNGPGSPNSLFSNQLRETGELAFVDVASAAGVAATAQDSSGCVAGDLDNDGDKDLLVLGHGPGNVNLLFENRGNGEFVEVDDPVIAGDGRQGTSVTLLDADLDGLLDVYIGHTFDFAHSLPIFALPTELNQHNQLLRNLGGLAFEDVSAAAGVEDLAGIVRCPEANRACDPADAVPVPGKPAGITWAVMALDVDLDGDVDLVSADDQAAIPPVGFPAPDFPGTPNADRGLIHVFLNDGTGHFTDTVAARPGSWMGVASCDLDHDGALDLFGANFGDASISFALGTPLLGFQPSRWFFGAGDGTFADPASPGTALPGVVSTPFGWGSSAVDYDNDGDCDLVYVGNINAGPFIAADNPVAFLENDGTGAFSRDLDALSPEETDRQRLRIKHGSAAADLDEDGFPEIVSVANFLVPEETLLPGDGGEPPLTFPNPFGFGGAWDAEALISTVFAPSATTPGSFELVPAFLGYPDGDLSVLRNEAENGNGWVQVDTVGTVGITSGGRVNRDGVGAVVGVTPAGGRTALQPVAAGDSYASQNSEILSFGLGEARRAVVEVLWPGGVRNRLYDVRRERKVLFPEIPCSVDGDRSFPEYARCVHRALDEIVAAGILSPGEAGRFRSSALRAFREAR
ncbi:MAG: CRTAC1 family protein [Thermoanaerobaculia bacterium]